MSLTAGSRLGPYEILAPIGAGGMGEVYRALDHRLGRDVAIKVSKQQFTGRFEREARAVAALNHPQICKISGFCRTRWERLEHRSLGRFCRRSLMSRLADSRRTVNGSHTSQTNQADLKFMLRRSLDREASGRSRPRAAFSLYGG
jgi:serine/threonine protein kinase